MGGPIPVCTRWGGNRRHWKPTRLGQCLVLTNRLFRTISLLPTDKFLCLHLVTNVEKEMLSKMKKLDGFESWKAFSRFFFSSAFYPTCDRRFSLIGSPARSPSLLPAALSQFAINNITSDNLRYHYVVANMSELKSHEGEGIQLPNPWTWPLRRQTLIGRFSDTVAAKLSNFERTTIDDHLPLELFMPTRQKHLNRRCGNPEMDRSYLPTTRPLIPY